jgi:hypothetical protein
MKKKSLLVVVTSIIFLFGVVALASPITLLNDVFTSVKKSIFQAESLTQSQNSEIQATPTPAFPTTLTPNVREIEIPEYILWKVIWGFPEKFERSAEEARQKGEDASLWTNYFVRQAKLSEVNADIFKQKATEYSNELEPVSNRIQEISLQQKLSREKTTRLSNDKISELKKEFLELQEKQKELSLKYRDEFRKAIDEESFNSFEKWLTTEFAGKFSSKGITAKDIKTTVDQSRLPANGGFTSTQKSNKEDKQK